MVKVLKSYRIVIYLYIVIIIEENKTANKMSLNSKITETIEAIKKGRSKKNALNALIEYIKGNYSNKHTQKTYLSLARKALRKHGIEDNKKVLSLSDKDYKKLNDTYVTKRNKKALNLIPIQQNEFDAMVKQAVKMLDSDSYLCRLSAILLLTGRRTVEICKGGVFVNVSNKDYIRFRGLAKKRTEEKQRFIKIFLLGGNIKKIQRITKELQLRFADKTEQQINKMLASNLKRTIKKYFPKLDNHSAHELRKLYAAKVKKDNQLSNANLLLSQVLGHSKNDATTALSYEKYVII